MALAGASRPFRRSAFQGSPHDGHASLAGLLSRLIGSDRHYRGRTSDRRAHPSRLDGRLHSQHPGIHGHRRRGGVRGKAVSVSGALFGSAIARQRDGFDTRTFARFFHRISANRWRSASDSRRRRALRQGRRLSHDADGPAPIVALGSFTGRRKPVGRPLREPYSATVHAFGISEISGCGVSWRAHSVSRMREVASGQDTRRTGHRSRRSRWMDAGDSVPRRCRSPSSQRIDNPDFWFAFRDPVEVGWVSVVADGWSRDLSVCCSSRSYSGALRSG